ncbi:MAG TPA: class I SAM-dependent methyltransferase [Fimbriimonadaceae bacterium]|nr:class I SAM-dependent methyltransferase [Fimbriimonadaceae bacterium]
MAADRVKVKTPAEYWDGSAPAWLALMERGDLNRKLVIDPAMLRLAGDVRGRLVCDVGCGEGRFCRMLAERGAKTVGIEPTGALLQAAAGQSVAGSGLYARGDGIAIPVASDAFDLVVCYLVLIDILDYRAAIGEIVRIVKPSGRILIANMNSFCTTVPDPWIRDENGRPRSLVVDDYFSERADVVAWAGIEIVNYHRPFSDYMAAFLGRGLRLEAFEEPAPTPEAIAEFPRIESAGRIPVFHVMLWRKV